MLQFLPHFSPTMENIVLKSQGYEFMYKREAVRYIRAHNLVIFVNESLCPIIGGCLLEESAKEFLLIFAFILFALPVLRQILNRLGFDERAKELTHLSAEYARVRCLAENRDPRASDLYNELLIDALPISDRVIKEYIRNNVGLDSINDVPEIARDLWDRHKLVDVAIINELKIISATS
jgi:hypothetical protein